MKMKFLIYSLLLNFCFSSIQAVEKAEENVFYIKEDLILNYKNKNIIINVSELKQKTIKKQEELKENLEKEVIEHVELENPQQKFLDSLNFINNMHLGEGKKLFQCINSLLGTNEHLNLLSKTKYKEENEIDNKNRDALEKYSTVWNQNILKVKFSDSPNFQEAKLNNECEKYIPEHTLNLSEAEINWATNSWESEIIDLKSPVETTSFETKTEAPQLAYRCGSGNVPRVLVIAHEFLHYLHFLENPIQYTRDRTSLDKKYHAKIANLDRDFRWRISEEERTLIGREEEDNDVSELSIRSKEGLPIRYAYQGKDQHFYEKLSDLEGIFPKGYSPKNKEKFSFDEEKASNKFVKKESLSFSIGKTGVGFKLPLHLAKRLTDKKKEEK